MTDIVERLRERKVDHERECLPYGECYCWFDLTEDAADEIERLRALITEWAEADRGLASMSLDEVNDTIRAALNRFDAAEAALREEANR